MSEEKEKPSQEVTKEAQEKRPNPKGEKEQNEANGSSANKNQTDPQSESSKKSESKENLEEGEVPKDEVLADSFFEEEAEQVEKPSSSLDAVPVAPGTFDDEPIWGAQRDVVVPPLWQPVLPMFMIILSLFVLSNFYDDFRYFFSPRTALELGSRKEGCPPSFYTRLKHNRYVHLGGIFAQPTMVAEATVRLHKQNYIVVMGCNLLISMTATQYKRVSLHHFGASGRLIQAVRSGAIGPVKKYYAPSGLIPFDQNTYILYANERPSDKWWIVFIYFLLFLLLVVNVRAFAKSVWLFWIKREEIEGR